MLNYKKLDAEVEIDPLFKKTCSDFDEGGARGLLLNNLQIGQDSQIIFDATNVPGIPCESEQVSQGTSIDISKLKGLHID